jgi:hypothetical protein
MPNTLAIPQNVHNMAQSSVSSIVERIVAAAKLYTNDVIGSRESLINLSETLTAALEIPSEFIQRSFWAEVNAETPNIFSF